MFHPLGGGLATTPTIFVKFLLVKPHKQIDCREDVGVADKSEILINGG
jgi:hypothetical protein